MNGGNLVSWFSFENSGLQYVFSKMASLLWELVIFASPQLNSAQEKLVYIMIISSGVIKLL